MTRLEEILTQAYEKRGMQFVYDVCAELLSVKDKTGKKPIVNGDVCENLLLFMTKTYIKERGIKGDYVRGLVLKDPSNPDDKYRTEIDFVFYTPSILFCMECKSYSGHKTITEKGLLDNGRYTCDIYAQNSMHAKILHRTLFSLKRNKYQQENKMHLAMGAFLFSNGDLDDKRASRDRAVLPILTQDTLYKFYDSVLKNNREPVWNYEKVDKVLKTLAGNEKLRREHKDYLQY